MSCHVRKVYSCAEPSGLYLTFTETDDVAVTLRKSARPLNNVNGMFGMNGMNGVNGTSGMNYMNCMMPNSLQSMMNMMQQHTHMLMNMQSQNTQNQGSLKNLQILKPQGALPAPEQTEQDSQPCASEALESQPTKAARVERSALPVEDEKDVNSKGASDALSPEEQARLMMEAFKTKASEKKLDNEDAEPKPRRGRPKSTAKAKAKAKATAKAKAQPQKAMKKMVMKVAMKKVAAKKMAMKKQPKGKVIKKDAKTVKKDREYYKSIGKHGRKALRPNGCYKCRFKVRSPSCFV